MQFKSLVHVNIDYSSLEIILLARKTKSATIVAIKSFRLSNIVLIFGASLIRPEEKYFNFGCKSIICLHPFLREGTYESE